MARQAAWAPLLVFVAFLLSAGALNLFAVVPNLDVMLHFAGGLAMCYFVHRTVHIISDAGVLQARGEPTLSLLAISLTCLAAVAWEFAEYLSDHTLGTHMQLGLDDTMKDLLVGLLGGSAFLLLRWVLPRRTRG